MSSKTKLKNVRARAVKSPRQIAKAAAKEKPFPRYTDDKFRFRGPGQRIAN